MTGIPGFFTALGLGALHSLEPGHGKGIMGSYLAVSRGSLKEILALGITSALIHTSVVLVLALSLHSAAAAVSTGSGLPPARFETYLRMLSGILIITIGVLMLRRAISVKKLSGCSCPGHAAFTPGSSQSAAGAVLVGLGNGLIPCPGALAVVLMSLNSDNLWMGIWIVLGFGIGGALSLVAVGLLFSRLASMAGFAGGSGAGRLVALASSVLITGIGLFTITGTLFTH